MRTALSRMVWPSSIAILRLALIIAGLSLLAFVDVIVLERIYKPMALKYAIPWREFETTFLGREVLWWHVAFTPLAFGLFALLGLAGRDYRLAVGGMLLFATGWEDIIYYLLQLQWIPGELPWLDMVPLISWTRLLTRSPHVTDVGLFIAAGVGGAVATLWIIGYREGIPPKKSGKQFIDLSHRL